MESFVFIVWMSVLFGSGPFLSVLGAGRQSVLVSLLGLLMSWCALLLTVSSTLAPVFNRVSMIPVLLYAFVSAFGLIHVAFKAVYKKHD